jgi:uncharacterized protein with gpF-like domain
MVDEFLPREAIAYLESKGIKVQKPGQMWTEEHAYSLTVAGVARRDILASIKESLERALREGKTYREWASSIKDELDRAGWANYSGDIQQPYRLATIYDTNMRVARAAGAWQRIERTSKALPYLEYKLGPSRLHRDEHAAWAGTILPAAHEWWSTHYPPNGYGCRCWVRQLSAREAEARGVADAPPPGQPDQGWATNPGKVRASSLADVLAESEEEQ